MNTLRILSNVEAKSAFGQQLYLRVPGTDIIGSIYSRLLVLLEVDEQVRVQLDQYI